MLTRTDAKTDLFIINGCKTPKAQYAHFEISIQHKTEITFQFVVCVN